MALKFIEKDQVPPWLPSVLKKFGALTVRVGDIVRRDIFIQEGHLKPGEPAHQNDIELVQGVRFGISDIPWVKAGDRDSQGRFSTSGMTAVAIDEDNQTAIVPRVDLVSDDVLHVRTVIGHVETQAEYVRVRTALIGDVPAGYARLRGASLEPSQEDVPAGPSFSFKL